MKPSTLYSIFVPFLLLLAKPHTPIKEKYTEYYFHYTGTPGNEYNPALWDFIGTDLPECPCTYMDESSCIISIDPDVVVANNPASFEISALMLYWKYGLFRLPVRAGIGPFQLPDEYNYPGMFQMVINTSIDTNIPGATRGQ